jgi:hypothetical protein
MTFLKLAPFAQSYDFWIAIFFCYIASLVWLYLAYRASRSGSITMKIEKFKPNVETHSDENIPLWKHGYFVFFCLHIVLGSFFFWVMLWPDHKDVWFIN